MSDAQPRRDADLRTILIVVYGLFVLAIFNGLSAIVGVIIAYMKRDEARGTLWEGHFHNIVHVFWIALGVAAIALVLLIEGPAASSSRWRRQTAIRRRSCSAG